MSYLRDLAEKIDRLAREHPAYSQAYEVVQNCVDHLSAKAALEEQRQPKKCNCEQGHDRPYWDCPVHGRTSLT